ncbi:MAG TPA: twin-arginine translocase subunit TatC [Dehalococcoidia bacterium]|nr:twin-arginine translocase subunit TatC [Chloroflexota bacterium]HHZ63020.1 twin-arginine translocase subunit TatC [Dehalococcoidia bacterium]HIM59003.1 twin-arginine translocase subunit TatC [Dehalococcoidia bacterium]
MNDNAMSVLQHLGELKRRLVRVAIVAVVFIAIAIAFYVQIFEVFTDTARRLIVDADGVVAVQRITEGWVVAAKLAILVGLVAAFPYFMWELAMFFKPGLKPGERKYIFLLVPASMAMFALGAAFSWFILIPRLVEFLLRLSQPIGDPLITVGPLVGLMVTIMFWLGIIFEIPIFMFLLAKMGILTSGWVKTKRRWMILISFIFGAVATPTDPISQLIVAGPTWLLFEIGMLLVKLAERGQTE